MKPESAATSFALHQQEWMACTCIQQIVAIYYGCKLEDFLNQRKATSISVPRMIAMYLCRNLTRASYPTLGCIFHRDHTTVLSGVRRVERLMGKKPQIKIDVEKLMANFRTTFSGAV